MSEDIVGRPADEIEQLRDVIDRAGKAWLSLEPGVPWEGDLADAIQAAVGEIKRLRVEAARDFIERKRLESQVMEHAIDHARAQRQCNELRADSQNLASHAENAELRKDNERLYGVLERYSNRRGQLEARVAELHKDRERLDWMIDALASVRWIWGRASEVIVEWGDGESRVGADLRTAIDAAMVREKP